MSLESDMSWFQSSSSPKTGCKEAKFGVVVIPDQFQSSSSPKTGCKRL